MFIVMTTAQANAVRGETSPGYVLAPVPTLDGKYALPVRVLSDPAHASKHALLLTYPQAADVAFPATE